MGVKECPATIPSCLVYTIHILILAAWGHARVNLHFGESPSFTSFSRGNLKEKKKKSVTTGTVHHSAYLQKNKTKKGSAHSTCFAAAGGRGATELGMPTFTAIKAESVKHLVHRNLHYTSKVDGSLSYMGGGGIPPLSGLIQHPDA